MPSSRIVCEVFGHQTGSHSYIRDHKERAEKGIKILISFCNIYLAALGSNLFSLLASVFKFSMRASVAYDPLELFRQPNMACFLFHPSSEKSSERRNFPRLWAHTSFFAYLLVLLLLRRNSPSVCRDIYDFFPRSKGKYYENICAEKLNMKAMRRC